MTLPPSSVGDDDSCLQRCLSGSCRHVTGEPPHRNSTPCLHAKCLLLRPTSNVSGSPYITSPQPVPHQDTVVEQGPRVMMKSKVLVSMDEE
ncbi:hypothetical protein AAHA92_21924 [Salvia divinorum]|uniref:Uncharacterized protein n=1 Tax=Salvia divinorum TaxID=28513 RepID=A0ABD1GQH5_SALDI